MRLPARYAGCVARALLIIDFQNDFTPGGALGVAGGDEIAPAIRRLADSADLVIATRDWHPPDHSSFEEQGGPWPPHCVQDTEGAEIHRSLDGIQIDAIIDKGQETAEDGYSAFESPELARLLREHGIDEVIVTGIATDYCVRASVLDARREGFPATVAGDAIRAVEVEPGDSDRALEEMKAAGARVLPATEIIAGSERR